MITDHERKLLSAAAQKGEVYIYTHHGFNKRQDALNDLAIEMDEEDIAILIDDKVFTPFMAEYNERNVLAGIRISTVVR